MSARVLYSRSISRLCTAGAAALIVLAADSINYAQSADAPSGPRAAYGLAIEKVDALRQLQSLLADQADGQGAAVAQAAAVGSAIEGSRREVLRASEAVGGASECLRTLSRGIADSTRIAAEYQRAARESLTRAAEFSRARAGEAAARLAESESAFQARLERKDAMLQRVADVTARKGVCSGGVSAGSARVAATAAAFDRVTESTRDLASSVDLLKQLTVEAVDLAARLRSRGWLRTGDSTMALPPNSGLTVLRQRSDGLDGMARLQLRDPHPAAGKNLTSFQDAVLRLVVEEDARTFLELLARNAAADCTAAECQALLNRVKKQDVEARAARHAAEDELRQVQRTIQDGPGLGIFARDPSTWVEAQKAIESAFEAANSEVAAVVDSARRLAATLEPSVAEALTRAVAERRQAYRRVFGVPEPAEEFSSTPQNVVPMPVNPVGAAGEFPPDGLKRHAFEVLALRSTELPDYGAYTYVIFPERADRPEYRALLEAIVALTPAADPNAPAAVKKTTNLFEIPGKTAAPIDPEDEPAYARKLENYDHARALSLVQTAMDGVLTAPKVLRQFQRSRGPFLLTVPVPLERAKGTTQLFLADLAGYPTAGFQDLVKSYQNDLIASLPTTQALWRPPWNQRLALGLVNIGVLATGQNFVALRR